jgi:competence protein ComEA
VGIFRQPGAAFTGFVARGAAIGWIRGAVKTVSTGRAIAGTNGLSNYSREIDMNSPLIHKAGLFAGTLAVSLLLATGAQAADRSATPVHGAPAHATAHAAAARGAAAAGADKVNLNTADAATIDRLLLNIGPSKAQAIVDYRKQHGSFKSPEQLALVKGIGLKTVEKNRDRIVLGGGMPARQPGHPVAQR